MNEPLPPEALARLRAAAREPEEEPPRHVGRYEVLEELGRGGMGRVFAARDTHLGRRVALKVLSTTAGLSEEARARFAREAAAAGRLSHPHIAAVYDATAEYIAMQLVEGRTLGELPRRDVRRIVRLVRDAAHAVHRAHEQGIVHRDLKPSNLLVEERGGEDHVFVVDFGLAREGGPESSLSVEGSVLGTPAFMPPEQAAGRHAEVDARSDVYSLGATLFAALTGRPPFDDPDLLTLLAKVQDAEAPAPGLERDLDTVVLRCLAKEKERRYPDARALAEDLDRWLDGRPVLARRASVGYRVGKFVRRRRAFLEVGVGAALLAALVLLPIVLRARGEREGAEQALDLIAQVNTTLENVELYRRAGDLPFLFQSIGRGLEACDRFLERHDVAEVHYLRGRLLAVRGDGRVAREALDRALELDPDHAAARAERALLLVSELQKLERELDLGEVVGLNEDREEVARRHDALRAAARADLARVAAADLPLRATDRLFARAELARLEGRLDEAREQLEALLLLDGTHGLSRLSLARIALAQGDADLALAYAASAVDLERGFSPAYRSAAFPNAGAPAGAPAPSALRWIELPGVDGFLCDLATDLRAAASDRAVYAYQGLLATRRAGERRTSGDLCGALEELDVALEHYGGALTIDPEQPGVLNNRALCQRARADLLAQLFGVAGSAPAPLAAARADLERAVDLRPEEPAPRLNLGRLLLDLGEREAGARSLERARELCPAEGALAESIRAAFAALSERGG